MGQTAQASLFPDTQSLIQGPWPLPPGWEWVPLGIACQINPRRPRLKHSDNTPTSFLPMSGVDELEGTITGLEVRSYSDVARGFTYFEEKDVLFAKITPSMQNGKCAVAHKLQDKIGFGSTEFHVLRRGPRVTADWVHRFLRRLSFRLEAKEHFRGAVGQQRVPEDFLANSLIPVPQTIDIQNRIATRVQMLMADLKEARALATAIRRDTDRFIEAALAEVLSQLPANRCPLIEVLEGKPRNGWSPQCDNDPAGTPVLKLGAVLGFRFDPSAIKYTSLPADPQAHYWTTEGDILISRSNTPDLVGHAAICSGGKYPCVYPDLLMKMRTKPTAADPKFVVYWLRGREARTYIRNHAAGASSTMKKITQGHVCSLPFPKITLEEQRRVVAYLDAIQAEVDGMRRLQGQDAERINQVEQSILERAFRGEL